MLNQILIKYVQKRYLGQFESERFDSLQRDCTEGAPQYKLESFATMATYCVPDLPKIKGISATFSIPFSYLQMVPHMHDPAGI